MGIGALYITGGQQRGFTETDEWRQYGKGIIVRVDPRTGKGVVCAEYVSPPEVCAGDDPSISFKSGAIDGDRLYVCTSTEVLVYTLPELTLAGYMTLPCFNDLHHVRPTSSGTLVIANTGLDMVVEVSPEGAVVREWHVLGCQPWAHFSPDIDYRKVPTTKPHKAHPNHVFDLDGRIWVTRFNQRDAVCLEGGERMAIDVQSPHDGTPHGDHVYFTTVDGHLVAVNRHTLGTESVLDLNPPGSQAASMGWCRGLGVVDEKHAWVGFSRFRPTKFVENVSWIKSGFRRRRKPTHIALYDLEDGTRLQEIDLESFGMHTVFGVIAVPNGLGGGQP